MTPSEVIACDAAEDAMIASLDVGNGVDAGVGALGSAFGSHVQGCPQCGQFLERTLRMRAHLQTAEVANSEVLRLRMRLAPKIAGMGVGRPRRRVQRLHIALAAAVVLGSGTVVAAGGGSWILRAVGVENAPSEEPAAAPPKAEVVRSKGVRRAAEVTPGDEVPAVQAPAVLDIQSLPREVGSNARVGASKAEHLRWEHAAQALREENYDAADRALKDLSKSKDAVERDTAQLSLAQLWLTQGKTEEARRVLERLSRSGASEYVRQRAAELLK